MPLSSELLSAIRSNQATLSVVLELDNQTLTLADLQELQSVLENNTRLGRIVWPKVLPTGSEAIIKQIEAKLTHNNDAYRDRPSDYEYAMLSDNVYRNLTVGQDVRWKRRDGIEKHLLDWQVQAIFQDEKNGYYAAAYYHPKHHFLVLAHRGTEASLYSLFLQKDAHDLNADISIVYNKLSAQQISAYVATETAVTLAKEQGWHFSTTGHSLGGWLAQISLIHCHYDFHYPETHAVTFDNPGVGPMFDKLQDGTVLDFKISPAELDLITYVSAPNVVNTCHPSLGALYRLFPKQVNLQLDEKIKSSLGDYHIPAVAINILLGKLQEVEVLQWLQTVHGHSMAGIVDCFNPVTGLPERVETVQKWPRVTWHREDHQLQDWIRQHSKNQQLPDTAKTWAGQATRWALQWLGLGMGPLITMGEWLASYVAGKVTSTQAEKALNYVADLQVVQTAELVLNYMSGNADKSAYQAFLQMANATDYHPSLAILPLDQRYKLEFEAKYATRPFSDQRLYLRQFRRKEDIRRFFGHCELLCPSLPILPEFQAEKALTTLSSQYDFIENRGLINIQDVQLTAREMRRQITRYVERFPQLLNFGALLQRIFSKLTPEQQGAGQDKLTYAELGFDTLAEQLIQYYQQQDRLLGLFDERTRSIDESYINLAIIKEIAIQAKTREHLRAEENKDTLEKSANDFESLLGISSRESIFAKPEPIELSTLFQQHQGKTQRILVLGEPGIGKTTFSQYVAYQWSKEALWRERYDWVFWIRLRRLNRYEKRAHAYNWVDVIAQELFDRPLTVDENRQLKAFLQPALEQNKILFLLDGYDEIATQHADPQWPLKSAVDELLQMGHYLLASRPHAVADLRSSIDVSVQIIGFTPENIVAYTQDFFVTQPEKATRLQAFLKQNAAVQGVARIPLNLQLICLNWQEKESQDVPTLTELYDNMLQTLLRRDLQKKGQESRKLWRSNLFNKFKLQLDALATLAFYGLREGRVILPHADVEQWLTKPYFAKQREPELLLQDLQALGLLVPVDAAANPLQSDQYFPHKTFQEFFAGYYITRLFETENFAAKKLLADYKYAPALEVVWWFTAGLLNMNKLDAKPLNTFFKALVYEEPTDLFGLYSRQLVTHCLDETRVSSRIQGVSSYLRWINELLDLNSPSHYFAIQLLSHSSFIKYRPEVLNLLLQGLKGDFQSKDKAVAALRELDLATPEVLKALIQELLENGGENTLYTLKMLKPNVDGLKILIQAAFYDTNRSVRERAINALGELGATTPEVLKALIQIVLKDTDDVWMRKKAIDALGKLGATTPEVLKALIQIVLKDTTDVWMRREAIDALGKLGAATPEVLEALIQIVGKNTNNERMLREKAIDALGKLGATTPEVLKALIQIVLKDTTDVWMRREAIDALGKLGAATPEVLEALIQIVGKNTNNERVLREKAIDALGKLGATTPEVLEALIQGMKDIQIRKEAAKALGILGQATNIVLEALLIQVACKDTNEDIQHEVEKALWKLLEVTPIAFIQSRVLETFVQMSFKDMGHVQARGFRMLIQLITFHKLPVPVEIIVEKLGSEIGEARKVLVRAVLNSDSDPFYAFILFESLGGEPTPEMRKRVSGNRNPIVLENLRQARQGITEALVQIACNKQKDESIYYASHEISEAIYALGQLNKASSEVLAVLIQIARGNCEYGIGDAIRALGKLGQATPEVLEALIQLAIQSDYYSGYVSDALTKLIPTNSLQQNFVLTKLFYEWVKFDAQVTKSAKLNELIFNFEKNHYDKRIVHGTFYRKNQWLYFYGNYALQPQKLIFDIEQLKLVNKFFDQSATELPKRLGFQPLPSLEVVIETSELDSLPIIVETPHEESVFVNEMEQSNNVQEEILQPSHNRKLLSLDVAEDELLDEEDQTKSLQLSEMEAPANTTSVQDLPHTSAAVRSSSIIGYTMGWAWKAASTVFSTSVNMVASGYHHVDYYFSTALTPVSAVSPQQFVAATESETTEPAAASEKTEVGRKTTSSFNQPLSVNEYLSTIVPYVAHYARKYSPVTLPWNQERELTTNEKAQLKKTQTTLQQLAKDFATQKTTRAAQSPYFIEQFAFVEKNLQATQQQIVQMFASEKTTDTFLAEVENNTLKIKAAIHTIAQENQTLRHMAIQEQRLQRRNAWTGTQSATITSYNATNGQLQQRIIRDTTYSTEVVDLALGERSLSNNHGYDINSPASFWHTPKTPQQSLPTVCPVVAPRLG